MDLNSTVQVEQRGVECSTGNVTLPGRQDGITFGSSHGRVIVSITVAGVSTYAVLGDDAIDIAGHAFADAVTVANRALAPSLERVQ